MTEKTEDPAREPYDPSMVERYTDFRIYVRDALKAMNSTRSALADTIGMSRSMMSHMLNSHRRINPTYSSKIAEFFQVDEQGRNLLEAMIDLDNESIRARRSAWATLQAHQRYLAASRPTAAALKVLSSWWVCAIYELASTPAFRPDPRWLAATLVPRITEEQAERALSALLASGLLVPDEKGRLQPTEELQWTDGIVPPGEESDAVAVLQRSLIEISIGVPDRFKPGERHQSGAVIAIPKSKVPAVLNRLRQLEREVFHLATSVAPDPPDRVYAFTTQFFPLTGFASKTRKRSADELPSSAEYRLRPNRK